MAQAEALVVGLAVSAAVLRVAAAAAAIQAATACSTAVAFSDSADVEDSVARATAEWRAMEAARLVAEQAEPAECMPSAPRAKLPRRSLHVHCRRTPTAHNCVRKAAKRSLARLPAQEQPWR